MGGGGCSLKETSPGQTGTRADTAPPGGDCPRLHRGSSVGGGGGGGRQRSLIRFMGGEARREGERRAAGGAGSYLSIHCWYLLSRSTDSGAM